METCSYQEYKNGMMRCKYAGVFDAQAHGSKFYPATHDKNRCIFQRPNWDVCDYVGQTVVALKSKPSSVPPPTFDDEDRWSGEDFNWW